MTQIITSDRSDVDFDPESLTDSEQRRLDVIKDLDNLLIEYQEKNDIPVNKPKAQYCFISLQNNVTKGGVNKNTYSGVFEIISLQQPSYRGAQFEIILTGPSGKLLKLFNFYQKQINKNFYSKNKTSNVLHKFLAKRKRYRKRFHGRNIFFKKLTLYHEKLKIDMLNNKTWLINDVKYHIDDNKSYLTISSST